MAKKPDPFVDLHFPLSGIDVSQAFDQQPNRPTMVGYARTTRVGLNVRGYEPVTGRARGGQRHGISKFLAGQVSGANVIQHLNTITTVDGTGLSLGVPNDGSGGGGNGGASGTGGSGGGGFQPGGPGTTNGPTNAKTKTQYAIVFYALIGAENGLYPVPTVSFSGTLNGISIFSDSRAAPTPLGAGNFQKTSVLDTTPMALATVPVPSGSYTTAVGAEGTINVADFVNPGANAAVINLSMTGFQATGVIYSGVAAFDVGFLKYVWNVDHWEASSGLVSAHTFVAWDPFGGTTQSSDSATLNFSLP